MTELITDPQRNQLIKTMNMLGKLCPNHYGPYYCNEDCQYKAKDICPAELSLKIQHFLESIPDQLSINIEKLVNQRADYAVMLTKEDGIIIQDGDAVNEWLYYHTGAYQEILMATSMIKKEFGRDIELVMSIEPHWDKDIRGGMAILTLRLPSYDDNPLDRLDEISEALDDGKEDSDIWLLLTTDFHIMGASK